MTTAVATSESKPADPTAEFMSVRLGMLRRLPGTTVDLFIQYKTNSSPTLYY